MKTINKLWFDNERIYIKTINGEERSQSMRFFPRLRNANEKQRAEWTTSNFGIHWKSVDEDISFESFGWDDNDPNTLYHCICNAPSSVE